MDARAAMKEIKKGQLAPLYLCFGSEKYQIQEFIQAIQQVVVEPENRDLALVHYDLSETLIEQVIEEAETLPFLVERKLIIVRDTSLFSAARDNAKMEHKVDTLLQYISNPADHSVVIFVVQGDKLDERKKTVKAMKASGQVLSFMPLGGQELIQWVVSQVKTRHCHIDAPTAKVLIHSAGVQMAALSAEINKLCLYTGEGGTIQQEDIAELVSKTTEQNVFGMVEDIANLKLDKALSTFYELLKQREEPIKIAALIARQFRIMLQVKELGSQSYSQQQIASQLGLHPYAVKIAGEQARKFDGAKLRTSLSELAELDYRMKSGRIDKVLSIEMFLLKLGA
ncbi:DNA polymerase-3 subunit delta [Paenibacillus shirakamiensis]|uniref:DNA polymerase III subunit delta n=1 Tax=Paenibacillus shirakamiensis TaxID=1265935 RepID=A0ABS4JBQ8_9BACL|nr:DNA polymerase III subunit delta [Paenibacillus shirakamiensis]MBP1999133.1 DNA polymerase-3 subunit delta [Paenibacillus shirakamiensis]